jgi:uncharacterized membrane protein YfcA
VFAAALVPGVLIGAALGLLGGGGSVLTVPVFVYVLGFEPKAAIAMSLAVVGATSALGTAGHWRAGHVNVRIALVFGGVAMVGHAARRSTVAIRARDDTVGHLWGRHVGRGAVHAQRPCSV